MALSLTRLMGGLLFAVKASDPSALGRGAVLLLAAASPATFVPAPRATKVHPMIALRHG